MSDIQKQIGTSKALTRKHETNNGWAKYGDTGRGAA
jgi:hypothetical protein